MEINDVVQKRETAEKGARMNYNYTKTKSEIIKKKLRLLIDYKTIIACVLLAVGYTQASPFIFLCGAAYFLLHLVVLLRSVFSKAKVVSIDFILDENALVVRVEDQEIMFPYGEIKGIKEKKARVIVKMVKGTKAIMGRLEIPYDVEQKPTAFIEALKDRWQDDQAKDTENLVSEKLILAFKPDPKDRVINYIKYSKRTYFNLFLSIVCLFFSLMLIENSPISSGILIFLMLLTWASYYLDYRHIKAKGPLIYLIEHLDDERIVIKGDTLRNTLKIKEISLLNLDDQAYILGIEGSKGSSFRFSKKEIITGDINQLVKLTGQTMLSPDDIRQPIAPMIFAIISILCIPLVGIVEGTGVPIAFNVLFFMISLVLSIINLVKRDIIKRFVYIALMLDGLLLLFYLSIITSGL